FRNASRRMYKKPVPNGELSHLCPPQARKSTGVFCTSRGIAPSCWIASTTSHTPFSAQRELSFSRSHRKPLLHCTVLRQTTLVFDDKRSARVSTLTSPCWLGTTSMLMPRVSSWIQGTATSRNSKSD